MIDRTLTALFLSLATPALAAPVQAPAIDIELASALGERSVVPFETDAAIPYFDRQVHLAAIPAMIAVQIDPSLSGDARQAVRTLLDATGLAQATVQPSSIPGWSYIMLPDQAASLQDARRAVTQLSAADTVAVSSLTYIGEGGLPVVPTRDLLISFAPGTSPAQQSAILKQYGATVIEHDAGGMQGVIRAQVNARTGDAILRTAMSVNDEAAVEWAQSDHIYWAKRAGSPNDPLFPQQWALEQPNDMDMDALEAWAVTSGDASVRVVVLDSGIQQNHPDLNQAPGQTFVDGGGDGNPGNECDNHGTAVAGCIAAVIDNGLGVAGIAPNVQVQAGKIFNEISFFGFCLPFLESQDSWTAAGINWAASSGALVTNSSWGGGSPTPAITTAFDTTRDMGVIHFGAAGNDGTGTVGFPASLDSVNSVSALDSNGNLASFSTYGPGLFISAPGAAILTTDRTGSDGYGETDYTTIDGTSFASPYSAGVAALVLSVDSSLSPSEVEDILSQTSVDLGSAGYDTSFGWGFINAGAAVNLAAGAGCAPDLTGDGTLDFFDISAFINAFAAMDPAADFDGNGTFDFFDVSGFINAFGTGCP